MLASITVMFSLLIFITFVNEIWAQDSTNEPWFLGSGLEPREGYYYTICDYEYHFDVSSDPCYDIMLSFEEILQGPYGNVWMVPQDFPIANIFGSYSEAKEIWPEKRSFY